MALPILRALEDPFFADATSENRYAKKKNPKVNSEGDHK
jgi:hypothetical protein